MNRVIATGAIGCVFLSLLSWGDGGVRGEPAQGTARADSASFWPDSTEAAGGDSLGTLPSRVAEEDSVSADPFIPIWRSFMNADDTDVGLGSEMKIRGLPGYGWTTNSSLRLEKKYYRARDMEDVNEQLINHARKERPGLYDISVNIGETYSKKKTLGLARYGKDLIYDTTFNHNVKVVECAIGCSIQLPQPPVAATVYFDNHGTVAVMEFGLETFTLLNVVTLSDSPGRVVEFGVLFSSGRNRLHRHLHLRKDSTGPASVRLETS